MAGVFFINNIQCYIATARSYAIIFACQAFYTAKEIDGAKEALYVDVRETLVERKGKDHNKNDFQDMLLLLQNSDDEQASIPKFVYDSK